MTLSETKELVIFAREMGITHYKQDNLEFTLGPQPLAANASVESITEIPHRLQETASLLKMSDTELVDRLFPEPVEPKESEAQ